MNLKNENTGTVISKELSSYLRAFTTKIDRTNVSIETGIGTSTLRDVMFRYNNLTENNYPAIVKLTEIAKARAEENINQAKEALRFLNKKVKA